MEKTSLFVVALLLASIFTIVSSTSTSYAAEEPKIPARLSSINNQEAGQVVAMSGTNVFVVWFDNTPGNYDILFRRSTDNGVTWRPTVNLSKNPGDSQYPWIAVSGSNVYVIWGQANADFTQVNIFFRHSADNGVTWGPKIKISSSNHAFDKAQIASAGDNVYVFWKDTQGYKANFRRSDDNGATWKPITEIGSAFTYSDYPLKIVAKDNNVYLVWENDVPSGNYNIFFRRSIDSGVTWSSAVNLSLGVATYSVLPQLSVAGDNAYVAWVGASSGTDIHFRRSTDSGATWKSIVDITNSHDSDYPQMTASGSNVYLAWFKWSSSDNPTDIFFRRSTDSGATWQIIKNISNTAGPSAQVRIAISGSNVHVIWEDQTPGNFDLFWRASADGGVTWGAKTNLSKNSGYSVGAHIGVSGSNVYVVWSDDSSGNSEILLKRSINDGGTWAAKKNLSNNSGESIFAQIGF